MALFYDKRFVYFEWDDCLVGKTVYVADSICGLIEHVKSDDKCYKGTVSKNDGDCPAIYQFISDEERCGWRFVYYDPLLEYKRASNAGKTVEWKYKSHTGNWNTVKIDYDWIYDSAIQYRVAEEEVPKYLTKRQLSQWLAQGNGEFMFVGYHITKGISFVYHPDEENATVTNEVLVRKWEDTEWHEPTVDYCCEVF